MLAMANGGANYRLFWREFRRTFYSTGAVLPSGRRLCRALARHAGGDGKPKRVLEVGPGTGVVTCEIMAQLGPQDTLDIVELNDRFVAALRERLTTEDAWRRVADRVRIHHLPIEQFMPHEPFDCMISGLPLNNFPVDVVQSILMHLEGLAGDRATLSFFEYVGVRKAKSVFCSVAERKRLAGIGEALHKAFDRWQFERECVLANVPPAWVHHLRFA
jgi:phosphatidylethanolamine/phosphatidyl-N-methylethanolamine N-methyltransferase